jgi:hypothetical protein
MDIWRNGNRYSVDVYEYTPLLLRLISDPVWVELTYKEIMGDNRRFPLTEHFSIQVPPSKFNIGDINIYG